MRKSIELNIEPRLLAWARESIGFSPHQVASRLKSLKVTTEDVLEWESGDLKPRLTVVEKLAEIYKRSIVVFYLPSPPKEPSFPKDFRMLPDNQKSPFSDKTRLAIRRIWRVQSLAKELAHNIGRELKPKFGRLNLTADPEKEALNFRPQLGIDLATQFQWRDDYEAFYTWQGKIEDLGILVSQMPLPTREARGFSLIDDELPVIVVSSKDWMNGRIFTLFHETAHLLLRSAGVCEWNHETKNVSQATKNIEIFCNRFAGAVLAPKDALLSDPLIKPIRNDNDLTDEILRKLAGRFKMSTEAMLRRLEILNVISTDCYQKRREEWQKKFDVDKPKRGRSNPPDKCFRQSGAPFISLVFENRNQGKITAKDVTDYLELKAKHLPALEQNLRFRR